MISVTPIIFALTLGNALASPDFTRLRECLLTEHGIPEERLVTRDDGNGEFYEDLNFQWNTLYGRVAPWAFLAAEGEADVEAAVRCCSDAGVRVVARSGGHSYLKFGFGDENTLVVDLQRMNSVNVETRFYANGIGPGVGHGNGPVVHVATIGAGARAGLIVSSLWTSSRMMLTMGLCPTVGIGGFALGGGYGYFSRMHGLATDNLLSARMVDWTGRTLTASNSSNPDLWWALRGGGGGNFGIVTSMQFRVYHTPEEVGLVIARYPLEQFPAFFKGWQAFVHSVDRPILRNHVGSFVIVTAAGVELQLYSMAEGGYEEVLDLLGTWFPQPAQLSIARLEYPEFLLHRAQHYSDTPLTDPAQLANLTRHNVVGFKKVKSFYVGRLLSDEGVDHLATLLHQYFQWPDTEWGIDHYGGAINALAPSETAFVHRDQVLYQVQLSVHPTGALEEPTGAVQAMRDLYEAIKPLFDHSESYQNYLDEDEPDYLRRYYGANLERLVAVKAVVDPQNVFNHPMSIPTSL